MSFKGKNCPVCGYEIPTYVSGDGKRYFEVHTIVATAAQRRAKKEYCKGSSKEVK